MYQNGRLAYQSNGSGTLLATFTYDDNGVPTSVQVGSNPSTAPRYYYVYNGHGDVVNLADASGNIYASYSYDEFGVPLSSSESFPGGWSNPYRYDGRDDVRYDTETALYWMSVRAYDPTLGRFIARDPLGRVPLMGWTTQPYAYAGNNPLVNVDPSGQRLIGASGGVTETATQRRTAQARYYKAHGQPFHVGKCYMQCLTRGERVLTFLRDLTGQLLPGATMILDVVDFVNQAIKLVQGVMAILAGNLAGLAAVVKGLIHWVRDGLDLLMDVQHLAGDLGIHVGFIDSMGSTLHTISRVADVLTPIADVASDVLGFLGLGIPGWASDKLRSLVAPYISKWASTTMIHGFAPWLIKQLAVDDGAWIANAFASGLQDMSPGAFCAIPGISQVCYASWIPA